MTVASREIPLVDLKRQHSAIREAVRWEFDSILSTMRLFLGPNVEAFEREFSAYLHAEFGLGVSDGTTALHLALRACGIGPGDEVITVSHTFFATAEAIVLAGATPVFVDIDPVTHTIDVEAAESAVTNRTRAVVPVHLYGRMADMTSVMDFARSHGLSVIEDACQAHGARRDGRAAGTIGDVGCFSFYYSKNLGAYGEGGGVVTSNPVLAERLKMLRDHGSLKRYHHEAIGLNGRLDELQAAVLRLKLPRLDAGNNRRRAHATRYCKRLAGLPLGTPEPAEDDHVYHLFVIQTPFRDDLKAHLEEQGIGTGIHYPIPCHLQPACRSLGYKPGSLPVTEALVGEILSLPMFPELEADEVDRVCDVVEEYFAERTNLSTSVDAAQ